MHEPTKGEFQIPVLTRKRPGGYRNDLILDADYVLSDGASPETSIIQVTLSLEECYLRSLITDGKAKVCLNLSQRSFRTSYDLKLDEPNVIELRTTNLMPGAKIDLLPVIVANEDLEIPFVEGEMISRYRHLNPPFHAKRGFVLGYGEGKSYPLSGSSNVSSFFSISQMDEGEDKKEPFILDLLGDQITIKMRSEEYVLWNKVSESPSLINDFALLNASIGYPAIYQTVLAILDINERATYRQKQWYAALTDLLARRLKEDPDTFLVYSSPKEMREKAWAYTGIVLDGLLKESFASLLQKGRASR